MGINKTHCFKTQCYSRDKTSLVKLSCSEAWGDKGSEMPSANTKSNGFKRCKFESTYKAEYKESPSRLRKAVCISLTCLHFKHMPLKQKKTRV